MKVVVDAGFLGAHRGGDETFLLGLLDGLALRRGSEDTFPVLVSGTQLPATLRTDPAFPVVSIPRRVGPRHFTSTLPTSWRAIGGADLLVTTTHAPLTGRIPSVLVLGDLSFVHRPSDYPPATRMRLRTLVPIHARRARAVLVPSEYTRADVLTTYGLDESAVHVVPNRVGPSTCRADADRHGAGAQLRSRGVREPFVLYLGNLHPRKNVPLLIRAFRRAQATESALRGHRLVVAGGRWFRGDGERRAAQDDPNVVFLDRVEEEQRSWLLAHAEALAYISLFEGFGLPPLEAMAYGTPALVSSTTAIPEVVGAAAELVDPSDADAVCAGLIRVLTDVELRRRLHRDGPARAAMFDANRVGAAAMAALYRTLTRPASPTRATSSTGRQR